MANKYLSKEQELELGTLIQKSARARAAREAAVGAESFEVDGVTVSAKELAKIIRSGDRALNTLFQNNMNLVRSRAGVFQKKHPNSFLDREDLEQEGYLGMLRALEKYDPNLGNKFSTVAYYWIEQGIARSASKTGRLVRLPENREQDYFGIMKIRALYEGSGLTPKEIDEIAMSELKLSTVDFQNILHAAQGHTSLSRPIGNSDDGGAKELIDFVGDQNAEDSSEETVMRDGMRSILFDKLGTLSELEREVIVASFLIDNVSEKRSSTKDIREKYDLTPQRFKRVLTNGLTKLKKELEGLDISFSDFLE